MDDWMDGSTRIEKIKYRNPVIQTSTHPFTQSHWFPEAFLKDFFFFLGLSSFSAGSAGWASRIS